MRLPNQYPLITVCDSCTHAHEHAHRYGAELAPYKYAGYPLLLDTIRGGTALGTTTTATSTTTTSTTSGGAAAANGTAAGAGPEAAAGGSFFSGEALDQVGGAAPLCAAPRRDAPV